MRFLRGICRLIFGLTFVISGFFKLLDPVGTGLIFKEYLTAFHMVFLIPASVYFGMALSILEFLTGISILLGLRMRIMSAVGFAIISFFTLLTLYLALFNPISDCGCFGEAIHLTNWQTFIKNLVLLPCGALVFIQRKKYVPIAPPVLEWIFMGVYGLFGLLFCLHSLITLPFIDFTDYSIGTDLSPDRTEMPQYDTVFIYEKDGRQETFSMNDLPDSTWTFVDSKTTTSGDELSSHTDFSAADANGEYWTDAILAEQNLIAASVYYPDKMKASQWYNLSSLQKEVIDNGGTFVVLSAKIPANLPDSCEFDIYTSDIKTLMTLNRSNGGVTYLSEGIIAQKWSANDLPHKIGSTFVQDPETLVIKNDIRERIQATITLLSIIVIIILMRYICRISYRHKEKKVIGEC